jgi:hypothetical protein
MDAGNLLALILDPTLILKAMGMEPDPWQREVLFSKGNVLLNCCRGAGKSRVTSALALHTAISHPKSLTLLISRSQRQSGELFRYVRQAYSATGRPIGAKKETETTIELENDSRVVCLPGREETIRSFQGVNLLVLDEASRIPDDLYGSTSPMTAIAQGRTVCLTTPYGQRGFFWKEWYTEEPNPEKPEWLRFRVPWQRCPRHRPEFIDSERRKFGDTWVSQEYECSFESMSGLVYPDFELRCGVDFCAPASGAGYGGIDFGFRNPFAAIWGYLDSDGVLWITDERYKRECTIKEHCRHLPKRRVTWYADPAGANEIASLRYEGYCVRKGNNDIAGGIAAVKSRVETGRLKVVKHRCPNLLAEARLYHYGEGTDSEVPVDEYNHALAALRYMVSKIDHKFLARFRRSKPLVPEEQIKGDDGAKLVDDRKTAEAVFGVDNWLSPNNPALWGDN